MTAVQAAFVKIQQLCFVHWNAAVHLRDKVLLKESVAYPYITRLVDYGLVDDDFYPTPEASRVMQLFTEAQLEEIRVKMRSIAI